MYDPSMIERYALPRNISRGLGWTSAGTINLGSTKAYIDALTPMPESDGKLYAWGSTANPLGGHFVVEVGAVDAENRLVLDVGSFDIDGRLVLTQATDEIVALQYASTLVIPSGGVLSTYFGSGCGTFIAVADARTKTYITGAEGARFSHLEGEGMLLDNVTISYYAHQGILLSLDVGTNVLTHVENVICDDRALNALDITNTYTGKLIFINNTADAEISIEDLNDEADITIRNNVITLLLLDGDTDFTDLIRNNYIKILTLQNSAVCPDAEPIGTYWHTLNTLEEMESYRGNSTGLITFPYNYGYMPGYGKVGLGASGGVPYLLPVEKTQFEREAEVTYRMSWEKRQPQVANSYRISLHTDLVLFPTFVTSFVDVGDVSDTVLQGGKTLLDAYPSDNDGNNDGVVDPILNLKTNTVWYFIIQAQFKLGERLSVHLSDPSKIIAIPVRSTGAKAPPYSVGLAFPVQIQDGAFVLAERSDSIKASLYSLIMTNPHERFLSSGGAGLRSFLFEGEMDESLTDLARNHMVSAIEAEEPRIKIQAIYLRNTETAKGENAILVNIIYTDLESGETDNFSIGLGNYGRNDTV